jgi:hypothetical protein
LQSKESDPAGVIRGRRGVICSKKTCISQQENMHFTEKQGVIHWKTALKSQKREEKWEERAPNKILFRNFAADLCR